MLKSLFEVLFVFFRLGLTSFGGPVAHLGYFHDEFVVRRKWLDEKSYADLVAFCQFLPGPASSQVGISIGLSRAGVLGGVMAWIGFTLPSAIALVLVALGLSRFSTDMSGGLLHGLKIVAVAVVAQAIWKMGSKLCVGRERISIAIVAAVFAACFPFTLTQIGVIVFGGVIGVLFLKDTASLSHVSMKTGLNRRVGALFLLVFAALLFVLPLFEGHSALNMFSSFFQSGSMVFGGGHVVLPLLKSEVVGQGWVTSDAFMAGYGASQAIPGPLFTFSAYLGAMAQGWQGALICLVGIFLPSFLLIYGALPFWEKIRQFQWMRMALQGINAAVVGLLLAAFFNPVWTSAIFTAKDFSFALFAFLLLAFWKVPPWLVVLLSATAGFVLN